MGRNPWISFAIVAGHLLALASIYLLVTTSIFVFSAERTTGVVISVERLPNHRVSNVTINFQSEGQNIRFSQDTKYYAPKEGDSVPVLYPKDNPGKAQIGYFWNLWIYVLVFSFLAVLCYVAAYFAREDDEPQALSATFLIFNDLRARAIAVGIVVAVALLRAWR
jgi:hypothetical protein